MADQTKAPDVFVDADNSSFRAVLIPARVQFFRTPEGGAEHAVGTVEVTDLDRPMRDVFGPEIRENGAAGWAKAKAQELLG